MTGYKFVHAADLHLDSPFRGRLRDASSLGPALRDATFRAYESIIDLCIEEGVDALLIAGDVYDGAASSLGAQLRFKDGLQRLEEAGIRAFVCHGNHDPLDGWKAKITFPPNVVRFGKEVSGVPFNPDDPSSPMVYGISYPTRDVQENLVSRFPAPESGRYCIGLLHANVGTDTGHESYAPCSLGDLVETGYDYWALGHVHTRAVLHRANPVVAYPGNPQGRHINEDGERGIYVVEVDGHGGTELEFRSLEAIRWDRIDVGIEDIKDEQALLDTVDENVQGALRKAKGSPLLYRLRFRGRGAVHATLARPGFIGDVRADVNNRFAVGAGFAFCESIEDDSSSEVDAEELRKGADFLGDLLRLIDGAADADGDTDLKESLLAELSTLYEHRIVGRYLGLDARDALNFDELLAHAERILIDELVDGRRD